MNNMKNPFKKTSLKQFPSNNRNQAIAFDSGVRHKKKTQRRGQFITICTPITAEEDKQIMEMIEQRGSHSRSAYLSFLIDKDMRSWYDSCRERKGP